MEPCKLLKSVRRKGARRSCCVVNCSRTERMRHDGEIFYSFPNRPWEEERKLHWIKAVRREM